MSKPFFVIVKRFGLWAMVLLSLVVTVLNRSSTKNLGHRLGSLAIVFALSELLFISGGVLALSGIGQKVFSGTGWHPKLWVIRLWKVKSRAKTVFEEVKSSRLVRQGFSLNCIGATLTGLVFLIGPILLLPPASWGLSLIGVFDLSATLARCWPCYLALKSSSNTLNAGQPVGRPE